MEDIDNKKIILVGNGPSVLKYTVGKDIDMFETVVRFNNFVTSGYEQHIGSKVDIWARNNSKGVVERNGSLFKQVFIVSPEWNFVNVKKISKEYANSFIVPHAFAIEVQKIMKLEGKKTPCWAWPTSGIITLYYFIHYYPVVYIHGFDHFSGENHYFGQESMISAIRRAGISESILVNDLIKEGRVQRLVTEDSDQS